MKPIKLQFSGLHSYMEQQMVDFTALGAYGLFGIFGPTGAGKSTILDAITLALYGKVVRAAGNLNGIIHLQCEKAWVSLQFSLGDTVYIAERLLERDKKEREKTNTKQCRLYDQTHDVVLADKAKQVDSMILSLLGIGMEDFCRAVVLPQGKFQEFLTLTGKDRGEMLENIFGLERYGDILAAKISHRRSEEELALASLQGELTSVSAYTVEDEADFQNQLYCQQQETKCLAEEKKQIETTYHLYRQLQRSAEELTAVEKTLTQLYCQQSQVDAWQALLGRMQILRSFVHTIEQMKQLEIQIQQNQILFKQKEQELQRRNEERLQFAEKEKQIPQWEAHDLQLKKISQELERLVSVFDRMEILTVAGEGLRKQKAEYEKELYLLQKQGEELKQKNAQRKEALLGLEKEKKEILVFLGQRDFLQQVNDTKQQFELQEKNYKQLKENCMHNSKKILSLGKELYENTADFVGKEKLEAVVSLSEEAFLCQETLFLWQNALTVFADQYEILLEKSKVQKEATETAWVASENLYLRQQLAQQVKEGEPCPVCGSLTHPHMTLGESISSVQLETLKQRLETHRAGYEQMLQRYTKGMQLLDQLKDLLVEYEHIFLPAYEKCVAEWQDLGRLQKELFALCEKRFGMSFLQAYGALQQADSGYLQFMEEESVLRQQAEQGQQQLERCREQYRKVQGQLQEAEIRYQSGEEQRCTLEKEIIACCKQWQLQEIKTKMELQAQLDENRLQQKMYEQQIQSYQEEKKIIENNFQAAQQSWQTLQAVQQEKIANCRELREKIESEALARAIVDREKPIFAQIEQGIAMLSQQEELEKKCRSFQQEKMAAEQQRLLLKKTLEENHYEPERYREIVLLYEKIQAAYGVAVEKEAVLEQKLAQCRETLHQMKMLTAAVREKEIILDRVKRLQKLCSGKKLVKYLSQEYLTDMAYEATELLGVLTNHRYRLEVVGRDGFKENFVMVDGYNGGQMRPVKSLSGGETFLVSLALALALSNKIQLKGKYPLDFFFLDEGFGTLDEEKLEVVLSVLEKLPVAHKMVGIITHVPEMKNRLPRFLQVLPATGDKGSTIQMGVN